MRARHCRPGQGGACKGVAEGIEIGIGDSNIPPPPTYCQTFASENLCDWVNDGTISEEDIPYAMMQDFVAKVAKLVHDKAFNNTYALKIILHYAIYVVAKGNYELGLTYAASAFYRPELEPRSVPGGRAGWNRPAKVKDYSYKKKTDYEFGVWGFSSVYYGDPSNNNQLEHFIGLAYLTMTYSNNQAIGNYGAYLNDPGSDLIQTSDRRLGEVAAWWASESNPDTVAGITISQGWWPALVKALDIIKNGTYPIPGGYSAP